MSDNPAASADITTRCCIAGGGPAGMMLGVLLARAGVDVVVLEKHADFLRDFRGDTIHPSTLQVMHELGQLEAFLKRPHQEARTIGAEFGSEHVEMADFTHLPTVCKFIALMPQWDFLNFLSDYGRRFAPFHLMMKTEANDLIVENDHTVGLKAHSPQGPVTIRADLVIAADGRHSTLRQCAGLVGDDLGAPMDVVWLRLPRHGNDESQALGHAGSGGLFVMIDRGDYWQCALVIEKGGYDKIRGEGIEAFRNRIVALAPALADRVGEIKSFDDVKLLTVTVDRLRRWYRPGFLCIGDAAHAMSPIGGVGINLAIQDAVAAANILAAPLASGAVATEHLRAVQMRREWPTRITQRIQLFIQDRLISRLLESKVAPKPPFVLRLFAKFPLLRRIPARIIGLGVQPEHVRTPERGQ